MAANLVDLDLYDNLIAHIKGLEDMHNLTSLDLSFNKIKHIKNVAHLVKLTDLYFVQNKISRIEGLDGLGALRNLELGANRIRVCACIRYLASLPFLLLKFVYIGNRKSRHSIIPTGTVVREEQNLGNKSMSCPV